MIPYADFLFFAVLLIYFVVPTLLVRAAVGFSRVWILLATATMLVLQFGSGLFGTPPGSESTLAWFWENGKALWVLIGYAVLEYATAVGFLFFRSRTTRRWPYWTASALSLAPLAVAKFVPLFQPEWLIGFLGISYVTFRSLDVIFGIQDRLIVSLAPAQYFAFLFFFPTISSGPIDRYRRFADDWKREHSRAALLVDADSAVHHIFRGFLYKFIIAALVRQYWMERAAPGDGLLDIISYMYAYSFYLFFDFAGYSAFAIGTSYLFGIHTPENFDKPFLARNIRDFWNRWHMTLSFWFRDHIYMRFVLAATKGRWFKSKFTASYLAFFLSFGLMGLWHGTEPYYLLYGCYHAALLVGFDVFARWNKQRKLWGDGPLWRAGSILITFHVVCFGFLLFSGHIGPVWATEQGPTALYHGSHDTATAEAVTGWAWDQHQPDEPVRVDVFDGLKKLATVPADQFRADLRRAGRGNGRHAFSYPLPAALRDGKQHEIWVKIAGTNQTLNNTPKPLLVANLVEAVNGLEGNVDRQTDELVTGWAWDSRQPNTPLDVDVYDGDFLLDRVAADQFRPDLRASGIGDGRHQFSYRLPDKLKDGKPHFLRVRVANTNVDLKNTPQLVQSGPREIARRAGPPDLSFPANR
jgi:membrane protein involved in D-alanine export